ncbi:30S ribosomal protein S16 [Candidatus Berkelbacteria bacterium]|nr:30S ribosomal protein S16 [Candidatus Berkelbacteria bacterium]
MLRMRLQRVGRKHDTYYRVVIAKKQSPVKGKFIESIGQYNPAKANVHIDVEKALAWLGKGVMPSNRVSRLLTGAGVKHKLIVIKKFREKSKEEVAKEQAEKEAVKVEKEQEKAEAAPEKAADEKAPETPEQPKKEEVKSEELKAKTKPEPARNASQSDAGGEIK